MLLKNTLWNLLGAGIPIIVALFTIPVIIEGFGTEQFGVLALIWALVGYFSIFDLGLGRAITQNIAALSPEEQRLRLPGIFWTGMIVISFVALLAMVTILLFAQTIVVEIIKPGPDLVSATRDAVMITAIGIPVVTTAIALRGVLEGYQRFDIVNLGRTPLGLWTFICPLLVLGSPNKLALVCMLLIVGRLIVSAFYLWHCRGFTDRFFAFGNVTPARAKKLLSFGGWMTVTNLVGPILVTVDRFVISAVLGVAFVAYYVTPFEIVTRTTIFAFALASALFPNFAQLFHSDSERAGRTYALVMRILLVVLFPVYLVIVFAAEPGLEYWLGPDFADKSALVLQILAIGVFLNSMAFAPFAFVQGAGRPDWTAKLHLAEALFYGFVLYFLIVQFGIVGAAMAWALRVGIDLLALALMVKRLSSSDGFHLSRAGWFLGFQMLLLGALTLTDHFSDAASILMVAAVLVWVVGISVLFTGDERRFILEKLPRMRRQKNET